MNTSTLYYKINSLPKELREEVISFLDFIIQKKGKVFPKKTPKAGFLKGSFEIKPGFDDPLDDFKAYME